MNKNFLKSVAVATLGLSLTASCAKLGIGKDSHKCATNKCSSKKEECNKCSSKTCKKHHKKAEAKTKK